jgi:tripartite-type tricarboxylate transporter receptor subunit TctC
MIAVELIAMNAPGGGHVDVVPITAAFAASVARQGQVRVLAVTSPVRLPDVLAEVPTWREQGYDAVVSNWGSIFGPRGMTEPQIAYWEQAFARFVESEPGHSSPVTRHAVSSMSKPQLRSAM